MNDVHSDKTGAVGRTRFPRRWFAGGALIAAFAAGVLILPPLAAQAQEAMHATMGGHGASHAMMKAHVEKMLDEVGATADQKAKIEADLQVGMKPMAEMHGQMSETHAALHRILSAPTIDRAALEQLRATEIARIDQASRTMVQAMADAAEVLSPAQRAKFATLMQAHHAKP